jgi:hypothetical protein
MNDWGGQKKEKLLLVLTPETKCSFASMKSEWQR